MVTYPKPQQRKKEESEQIMSKSRCFMNQKKGLYENYKLCLSINHLVSLRSYLEVQMNNTLLVHVLQAP